MTLSIFLDSRKSKGYMYEYSKFIYLHTISYWLHKLYINCDKLFMTFQWWDCTLLHSYWIFFSISSAINMFTRPLKMSTFYCRLLHDIRVPKAVYVFQNLSTDPIENISIPSDFHITHLETGAVVRTSLESDKFRRREK